MDIDKIFTLFYSDNPILLETVKAHSEAVAALAEKCLRENAIEADLEFVREAALLHDIGVVRCDAPGIHCFGNLPYICHGIEGRKMLNDLGFPRHALVCERHTGAGLTINDIRSQNLPLPLRDMLPIYIEEKAICYADKFFSKSGNLREEKPLGKVMAQMKAHGEEVMTRFMELHEIFRHNIN